MKIYPQVLKSFIKSQTWLFHVVVLPTAAKKWTEVIKRTCRACKARDYEVREHIPVPYDDLCVTPSKLFLVSVNAVPNCHRLKYFKFEIENLESLERKKNSVF